MTETRRVRHGSDIAGVVSGGIGSALRQEVRTGVEPLLLLHWTQAHQLLARGFQQRRPSGQDGAHGFVARCDQALQAKVERRGVSRQFIAGHMAFLYPHDAECLGAIRHDSEIFASSKQLVDERTTHIGRHGNFVSQFARERHPV